jgi:hypothetical protein
MASAAPLDLVFACHPANDLYQVLVVGGHTYPRLDSATEAVAAAAEGGGVLILADGYPQAPTSLDDEVFKAAARKKLRLYVEFPARVPGLELGPVQYLGTGHYNAVVERTVVTSDAFGPDLLRDRILMIHDCHYLPVQASNPHLVLARVEGYDSLAYGLPAETHPILFEHSDGILVATTKLSQFVSGRYAPTAAWGPVWRMILGWLQPGQPALQPSWTPTVRPAYSATAALPTSARRDAVRRGAQWYAKSRLFMHPGWPKEVNGGCDPLPADAPVGDGSQGFAEGFIGKRVFHEGNQAVSRNVRADCNLEAAMGLACGARLFQDQDARERADRLGDLVFFRSIISQGPRANPGSPSYGLLGWDEGSNGTYWGDDNARAVLSAIGAAALLQTKRWDEAMVKTILANFRTTGPYGFRPVNLTEDALQANGWRHFYEREQVDYCPHMQCYPWAAQLWLYDKTRFEPLLQRARQGIRMMMGAYPNWRLEANRVEQERCRMLLPLAWLVRVDDTPEHRRWLETIACYVMDLQDPSGAIPQIPGSVVAANDGYGTAECAITHQAGDPATDALYSINFAFIGMHEAAAATGDERYAGSAAKMADFFIRTQTRSERRPELDGTWYRGFDFRKWDYWASDGDWGWGVWTAESGWTHSWITTTLALRELDTSLWSLSQDSGVREPFAALRAQMLPDHVLSERAQISLSGNWGFQADRQDLGEAEMWFAADHDVTSWPGVEVPIAFDTCGPEMTRYVGVGWFRKCITVPESFRGRRVALHFEGINYNARVWVNGKPVGENHDAFLPFTLPIDEAVQVGVENTVTVRVDNLRARGQFPLFEGWFGQGGFLREAHLVATGTTHLLHTFIEAEPAPGGGLLRVRGAATNSATRELSVQLQVRVLDGHGAELAVLRSGAVPLAPGQVGELAVEGAVPGVQPWFPGSPVLYTVHLSLLSAEGPLDALTRRVGFRRVEVRDARLLLNGEPLFLMGFNRHEDSPRTGMATDLVQVREDLTEIKKLGGNFVRLPHYPHHSGELDLCDELGLLVLAENAMNEWGHLDHPDPNGGFALTPEDAPLVLANARRTLRKMVERDNHHPSVILWSIGNENAEERADVAAGNAELLQYGRTLDRSRPWTHVSNCYQKEGWESFYRFDDVIAVNVYPSHHLSLARADLEAGLPEATQMMERILAALHRQFPTKPIVVGEFGYPGGESGPEGAQLQGIASAAEFRGLSAAYVAGGAFWVYARHPWADGAIYAGGQKNVTSPYGYVSRDRTTRFAALSVVERLFQEKAALTQPPAGQTP